MFDSERWFIAFLSDLDAKRVFRTHLRLILVHFSAPNTLTSILKFQTNRKSKRLLGTQNTNNGAKSRYGKVHLRECSGSAVDRVWVEDGNLIVCAPASPQP